MRSWEGGFVQAGVVVEGEEIVVDVAAGEAWRGYHGHIRSFALGLPACGETVDGLEADGFHVASTLQRIRLSVVFGVVSDMGVAAEELYGDVPLLFADCSEDIGVFWGTEGDVSDDEEEVDVSVVDGFLEPFFFDCVSYFLNDGIVGVACEVVEEAERYNADSLVLGRELFVPLRQRSAFAGLGIKYVDVGSEIIAREARHGDIVLVLGGMVLVEFVITRTENVDFLLSKDVECVFALRV